MALRKVGVIFTAEGYSQYMGELKQVNQEMRTMATQSKLAVAQLGNNSSTTDTYRTKMKSMGAEIQVSGQRTKMLSDLQKTLGAEQKRLPDMIEKSTQKYKESNETTKDLKKSYESLAKAKGTDADETIAAEKAYKASVRETNNLKKEMKELEVVYSQNGKQLEKLPNDLAKAELATQKLTNAQQKLHAEYRNQGGWLADTAKSWQDFGEKVTNAGDKMSQTGDWLTTRVTLPIIATGGMALKAAMDWETGFAGVMKTNDEVFDSTGKLVYGYEQLEDELRNLATTTLPLTHTELAGIAENAGQLGIATQDVVGFTEVIGQLGHTTNLSYDEASTALAQFLNVTGSGTDTVSNLASSIVALGNNTAATEKDILMMSQRWATTGSMIGLTDDQITGMSATLLSMGVNVESGGSAMQRFGQKVNAAVLDGGESLQLFADTSGVTAEEFSRTWNENPAEAIQKFMTGLDEVQKSGGNVNELLKDLGINSVQEVNAILALAGGHEQLATALDISANAYKENTALGDEFAVFADTTAAKVQIFKNKINDIAIEFGGPLADALTSALDAAEPWIEKLSEMAKGFSEMDEAGQRNILMWVGIVAAAGPILSIFGRITSASGKVITGVGNAIKLIGKWTTPKAVTDTATELGKIPGAASKAGGAAALFSNPWVIGGAVAIAGVSAFVAYMNHQANLPFAKHQEAVEETNGAYQEWFDGVSSGIGTIEELSQSAIEGATATSEAYLQALEDIRGANVDTQENLDKMFGDNFFGGNRLNYFEGEIFSQFRLEIDNITGAMQRLGATESEIAKVQQAFNNYGTLLTGTSNETLRIYQAEQVVTADWALSQTKAVDLVTQSVVTGLRERQDARKANLDAQLEGNYITQQVYQQEINNLNSYTEQAISSIQTSTQSIKEIFANASRENRTLQENELLSFTTSLANISKVTGESLSENQEIMKMLGDNMSFLSSEVMVEWMRGEEIMSDSMIKMFKNAGSTEEALGILVDALDAYGAEEIKPKEAYVETEDAKADLLELTDLANQWNDLTFEERLAQVETRGKDEIEELLTLLGVDWNNLTPEQKEYYAQAEGGEALENILYLTQEWDRSTDPQKKFAILETQIDSEALLGAIKARDLWNNADFMSLAMEIDTNAPDAKEQLVNLVDYFSEQKGLAPLQMETEALTEESQQKLAELISTYTGAPVDEVAEFLTSTNADDTTASIEGTGNAMDALGGKTANVTVSLTDNASWQIARISEQLSGLNGRTATAYVTTLSATATYAEGGHIDAYAEGGNIQYAGMFASGGNVPKGYSGIVGEAGPEIFTVTDRGVSITPLNSKEKMRGVQGAVADEVSKQLNGKGGSGGDTININITGPTFRDEVDMDKLVTKINKALGTQVHNKKRGRPA